MRHFTNSIKSLNPTLPNFDEHAQILRDLLDKRISDISGLAQPAHPQSDKEWKQEIELQLKGIQDAKDFLLDIACVLRLKIDEESVVCEREEWWKDALKEVNER